MTGRAIGEAKRTPLPDPTITGSMAVEAAIEARRSRRSFSRAALTPAEVGQLCWAAQGVTEPREGLRAAPSAGALYPLTLLVADRTALSEYEPEPHALRPITDDDVRPRLRAAALGQPCVGAAPVCLAIVMRPGRLRAKYGADAERYALLEAGHAAQNVLLQAAALGLAAVPVAAFDVDEVAKILRVPRGREPVYLLPVGRPRV